MKFEKMHGIGNDYIFLNGFEENISDPKACAIALCDRHFGVGADGIVIIKPCSGADFAMDIFNADGSEAPMCGNAIRCAAKYCRDRNIIKKDIADIKTASGIKSVALSQEGGRTFASVNMGKLSFERDDIPFIGEEASLIGVRKALGGSIYEISCVSTGNPHCVIFCDNVAAVDLGRVGALIERDRMFPSKTNVEFAQLLDEKHLKMRSWERNNGITLASGTGACAVVACAVALGHCKADEDITVELPGGELTIRCSKDYYMTLSGPAQSVFCGEITF